MFASDVYSLCFAMINLYFQGEGGEGVNNNFEKNARNL